MSFTIPAQGLQHIQLEVIRALLSHLKISYPPKQLEHMISWLEINIYIFSSATFKPIVHNDMIKFQN